MILDRIGNKKRIALEICSHFPYHKVFYEMFFGSGAILWAKPGDCQSIVNDSDDDVFNLFCVVKDTPDKIVTAFEMMPLSESLFNHWAKNKETDPVMKAIRFLMLSSFSYLGKMDTFQLLHSNTSRKKKITDLIHSTSVMLQNTLIRNVDFRMFFDSIVSDDKHIPDSLRFVYADPPYVKTTSTYMDSFKEQDFDDLIDVLEKSGLRFAISSYKNGYEYEVCKNKGYNIIEIKELRTIKSRNTEILITNYEDPVKQRGNGLFVGM